MQIISQCPFCGYYWLLDDRAADKRLRCKNCNRLFKVPNLEDVPKAVKAIKDSKGTVYVDESGKTYG
jgi:transposase-like protein